MIYKISLENQRRRERNEFKLKQQQRNDQLAIDKNSVCVVHKHVKIKRRKLNGRIYLKKVKQPSQHLETVGSKSEDKKYFE